MSAWVKLVIATTASSGWRWVMAAVAVTPSMPGISRSISTTSGGCPAATSAAICSRASCPSAASPTTSMSSTSSR